MRQRSTALERGNVGAQVCQHISLARISKLPGPRNGEEGLAVPVRAEALKPNVTQPVTHTRTRAWLWPRDPGPMAGRWGRGWGRLIHRNALAPTEATAARMPSRSFFVLDGVRSLVKIKQGTKQEFNVAAADLPKDANFPQHRGCAQANRFCARPVCLTDWRRTAAKSGSWECNRETRSAKTAQNRNNVRMRRQLCPSCSAAKNWDCYIRCIHLIAPMLPQEPTRTPELFSNALTQSDEFYCPGSLGCRCFHRHGPSAGPGTRAI